MESLMASVPNLFGNILDIVDGLLLAVGLWFLFRKCGEKGWWALIPGVRYYKLGQCADREADGRITMVLFFTEKIIDVIYDIVYELNPGIEEDASVLVSNGLIFVAIAEIMIVLIRIIYSIRIYAGLCEMFYKKKRCVLLWLFFEGLTSVVWGLNGDFLPDSTVPERRQQAARTGLDGIRENEDLDKTGLNIRIREVAVFNNLTKKRLLQDVKLHIPKGRMVLLLGGSGAGKTTLVNAVTGYEKAAAKILLDGRNVYTSFDEMKHRVGLVPQKDLMRDIDTVEHTLEDAALLRLPANFGPRERDEKVKEAMEALGIAKLGSTFIGKLSGGQRKRVSIAMEYLADPQLFILDEPDSGLDGVIARELMLRLRQIADEGRIVIVITHTPDRVIDLFDDVIVLAKDGNRTGRLAYYGPVQEAREFFGKETMEEIVMAINQKDEGGEGKADEFIEKYIAVRQSQSGIQTTGGAA